MNDFFKQFRENWENRPEPDFEEQDWIALEKRLDQQPIRSWRGLLFWWLLLPFLFLLLGSNIWSLFELRKANQKIALLEIQKDTVFQSHVTIQTDTIYQTRVIKETIQTFSSANPVSIINPKFPGFNFPKTPIKLLDDNTRTNLFSQKYYTSSLFNQTNTNTTVSLPNPEDSTINNQAILDSKLAYLDQIPLSFLSIRPPVFSYEAHLVEQKKKTIRQHLYTMRPKGYLLGAGGGWMKAFDEIERVNQIPGYNFGLQGIMEFSPQIRLWLGATFSEIKYEAYRMDEALGVQPIAPPSDEFSFFKAEVPQQFISYSMGMDYRLDLKGKIKPFFGAGFGAMILLPDETSYEFRNDPLDITVNLDHANLGRMVFSDLYLLKTGFDYQLSRNWEWRLWATYRAKWSETSVFVPRTFQLQTALMYRF